MMTYYAKHILKCGSDSLTLDDLLQCYSIRFCGGALDARRVPILISSELFST